MKILEQKPFIEPFTCRKCRSQLQPEIEDVRIFYSREDGYTPYVTCPICLAIKYLNFWSLSDEVIELAKAASK